MAEENAPPLPELTRDDMKCDVIRAMLDMAIDTQKQVTQRLRSYVGLILTTPSKEAPRAASHIAACESAVKEMQDYIESVRNRATTDLVLRGATERSRKAYFLPLGQSICDCENCKTIAAQDELDAATAARAEAARRAEESRVAAQELTDAVETALAEMSVEHTEAPAPLVQLIDDVSAQNL